MITFHDEVGPIIDFIMCGDEDIAAFQLRLAKHCLFLQRELVIEFAAPRSIVLTALCAVYVKSSEFFYCRSGVGPLLLLNF